jgi:pyruvate/2-oxoglutarate/acetoin dehydrogenase E1 component
VSAELTSIISRKAFDFLDAPSNASRRITPRFLFGPAAEKHVIPQMEDIRDAVYRC